ncbi:hypothetical protein QTP88_028572 [Uroleucon formosanum]
MDKYLECINQINECRTRYERNTKFMELDKLDRKYELLLNKKRIKELKIIKKKSSNFQEIKREILSLKINKHDIIYRYKWLEEMAKIYQQNILLKINELDEKLVMLRFNVRYHGISKVNEEQLVRLRFNLRYHGISKVNEEQLVRLRFNLRYHGELKLVYIIKNRNAQTGLGGAVGSALLLSYFIYGKREALIIFTKTRGLGQMSHLPDPSTVPIVIHNNIIINRLLVIKGHDQLKKSKNKIGGLHTHTGGSGYGKTSPPHNFTATAAVCGNLLVVRISVI